MKNTRNIWLIVLLCAAMVLGACAPAAPQPPADAPAVAQPTAAPPEETPDQAHWDMETEFLIIGAGVAGLTAAIEAADSGFEDVLVLEKLGVTGGSAFVSEGILGGFETQVTKALDIHVDPQDIYGEQMHEKKYNLDPELTMLTVLKSGETIDWLIDHLGASFQPSVGPKEGYGTLDAIHIVEGAGPGLRTPYEAALAVRPAISIMTETRAIELVQEDGAVVGAIATKGDQVLRIKAKAVMLATGGYNSNQELITIGRPANRIFQTSLMAGSTGDGLLMATKLGAAVQNLDQIQCYFREYENPVSQFPYMFNIFVGKEGTRFMNEKRTGQTYNQENRDDTIMQLGEDGAAYFWAINDHAAMTQFGIAEGAKEHAGMVVADSLAELAAATGIDATGLTETVARWNEMVQAGGDADFGRTSMLMPITEGPYYALKTIFFSSVCHGGIVKNEKAEVVQFDGTSIPGLYAAGEVTVATNSNGYTISNAITFGRIAAQSAYAYAK